MYHLLKPYELTFYYKLSASYRCLGYIIILFVCESFIHIQTWPLPVKECRYWLNMFGTHDLWKVRFFSCAAPTLRRGIHGHLRGPLKLTLVAELCTVELPQPVCTTRVCRGSFALGFEHLTLCMQDERSNQF